MSGDGINRKEPTMHPRMQGPVHKGSVAYGGWLTSTSYMLLEAYSRLDYDYVGLDCQHGLLDETDAARMLRRMADWPQAALVRVAANDSAAIGRVLDAGADGIIVPMVDTPEQAAAAVAATRYYPAGFRSFGPGRADMGFALKPIEERASCLVMIETKQGLDNVEAICATPGLTGVYVGPHDLGIGLGVPVADIPTSPIVDAAIARIAAVATSTGIVPGIAAYAQSAAHRRAQGYRLITLGADVLAFLKGASDELNAARATE